MYSFYLGKGRARAKAGHRICTGNPLLANEIGYPPRLALTTLSKPIGDVA